MSVSLLPHLNAILNGTSAVFLLTGYMFIRLGHETAHKRCMISALILGSISSTSIRS